MGFISYAKEFPMGYECSLHLIDVRIKSESVRMVEKVLKAGAAQRPQRIRDVLVRAKQMGDRYLAFTASKEGNDPYVPDEESGTVPALYGKWREAEHIAKWLKRHSEKGGRLILHSV